MKKKYPKKKFSIYEKDGTLKPVKPSYEDKEMPTICDEHRVLANIIAKSMENGHLKDTLLEKVDILYDMGKRMGNKLLEYHTKYGKRKGWRDGY